MDGAYRSRFQFPVSLRLRGLARHRTRAPKRGFDLISDALPFGRLSYGEPDAIANAIDYAKHRSRSPDAIIRVYDGAGNGNENHEHTGDFKEP